MDYKLLVSHNFSTIPTVAFTFERYIFNEPKHLQQQQGDDYFTFYWIDIEKKQVVARLNLIRKDAKLYSPLRATFGGIEFNEQLSTQNLFDFVAEIIAYWRIFLANMPLQLTFCPEGYINHAFNQRLTLALLNTALTLHITELNYHVVVDKMSLYEKIINKRQRQLLRKLSKTGAVFSQLSTPDLPMIHDFIARSRIRKNRPMTMTLADFERNFKMNKNIFSVFSLTHQDIILAVAVTVRINAKILYTFYVADNMLYLKWSPTISLLSGIYKYCLTENIKILDLGIASENGLENLGLSRFKRSLGAVKSFKKTYVLA
jgi:hypothetical protein